MKERMLEVSSQFDCDYDTAMQLYSFSDDVYKSLESMGVINRPRPMIEHDHESIYSDLRTGDYFDGRLPTNIRKLNLDSLSVLLNLFSNWHGFVSSQFTLLAAKRSEAIRKKEFTWSMVREMKRTDPETGKKRTDQQMSDLARTDIRFLEASANYERINAMYTIMESVVSITEQDLKTISREVTIKQTEIESQKLRANPMTRHNFPPVAPEVINAPQAPQGTSSRPKSRRPFLPQRR